MTNLEINQQVLEYFELEEALDKTKAKVDKLLNGAPYIIRDYTKHLSRSQGKFIRARGLLASSLDSSNRVSENAITMAAAIELLHLATLVHDDVIDDSDLRRGEETLQKKYGKRKAVICGDYLLSLALRQTEHIKDKGKYLDLNLPSFVSRICLGEMDQYTNNGNLKLSSLRYLKIIRGKTAAMFEAAFLAGGIFSNEGEEYHNEYSKLGRYLGMIFQLTDDCIDFESKEEEALKPVGRDFQAGVITLPLIYVMKENNDFKQMLTSGIINTDEIINQVINYKGIEYAKKVSKSYYDKSLSIINKLSISNTKREVMIGLLDKAYIGLKK